MRKQSVVAKAIRIVSEWVRQVTNRRVPAFTIPPDPAVTRDRLACEMVVAYLEAVAREEFQEQDSHPLITAKKAEETARFWELVERTYHAHREAMGLDP